MQIAEMQLEIAEIRARLTVETADCRNAVKTDRNIKMDMLAIIELLFVLTD